MTTEPEIVVPLPAHPEQPVSEISGSLLPTIVLPTLPKTLKRRIRSFGVLQDGDEASEGCVFCQLWAAPV